MVLKKIVDVFIVFSMLFGIVVFIIALIGAVNYWAININLTDNFTQNMWNIGLFCAVLWGYLQFLEIFINGIADSLQRLNIKKKEVK